ncbi:MAG: hypothetical protein JWO83_185 [Caulobacteraceae bacterium]|nr:hypothetical protein [Caulobacteraceae bacterium]
MNAVTRAVARGLALALTTAGVAAAQTQAAKPYHASRTEFGDPDLQGLWTNASITRLERPAWASKLVLTPEEAAVAEAKSKEWLADNDKAAERNDVGGYNSFWLDPGSKLGVVNGEIRTSWIVDPPTGRIPYSPEGGRAAMATGMRQVRDFSGPEVRSLGERCIVGYGSTGGPPMLNVLYNNNYQIVQSPGYVVIVVEMNHDARIVRLGGTHPPANVTPWMGDSVGHWEGDTLVVETTNLNPGQAFTADILHQIYLAPASRVTERFTRVSDRDILYEFKVEEPHAYTQTWRGEIPMHATKGPMYEYACHEGNYALADILAGAREQEKTAALAAKGQK